MAKYHISEDGEIRACTAKPGNCPLGGDELHFETQDEAQKSIDKQRELEHGLLPKVEKGFNETVNNYEKQAREREQGLLREQKLAQSVHDWAYEMKILAYEEYSADYFPPIPFDNMGETETPEYVAKKYLLKTIAKHKGEEVDFSEFETKDWKDIIDKEAFYSLDFYQDDDLKISGQRKLWDSYNEEKLYKANIRAETCNNFLKAKMNFVDEAYKRVQETDWVAKGSKTQEEGELKALQEIADNEYYRVLLRGKGRYEIETLDLKDKIAKVIGIEKLAEEASKENVDSENIRGFLLSMAKHYNIDINNE